MEMEVLRPLIEEFAAKYDLPERIVYGVCKQESGLNEYAARYERAYPYLYKVTDVKPAQCSFDTETTLQKTSFGLMQTMGGVVREYGFSGWLTEISANPRLQLEYGCRHLAAKIKKYGLSGGISAYNAGSPTDRNKEYVENVMKYAQEWRD